MSDFKQKTYVFKPSHPIDEEVVLNPAIVARNASRGIETSLLLDTNVLIAMERVVTNGGKSSLLKRYGIHNLVRLLNRCPPNNIALLPGWAFDEMPPAIAEKSRLCFEEFCAKHLPSFGDSPNCIQKSFSGKETDYGYLDLEQTAQAFLALPFTALLYLNIIDKSFSGSPIQKFEEFLRRLSSDLDMIINKEIEIAKYCFAEPPATAVETIRLRKIFRRNFLKTNKNRAIRTLEDAMKVAFNGASDLTLINVATLARSKELDGIPQDCWIATCDKKLFDFSKVSHYLDVDGAAGMFVVSTSLPEHIHDDYWQKANQLHQSLASSRIDYHLSRKIDPVAYVGKAKNAIEETAHVMQEV